MKIWAYENAMSSGIFISAALMVELKKSGIGELTYYPGFSGYGG
jgi:PII-like signaling protein